jgi:hypothetical protein
MPASEIDGRPAQRMRQPIGRRPEAFYSISADASADD